jgi:hypothetical protein
MTNTRTQYSDKSPPVQRLESDLAELQLPPLSEELRAKIRAEVAGSLVPKKQWSRAQRAAATTAIGVVLTLALAAFQSRTHTTTLEKVGLAGVWFSAVCFTLWRSMASAQPEERNVRQALALGGILAFFGYLLWWSNATLPFSDFCVLAASRHADLACAALSVTIGSLCFAGSLLLWRRTDPFAPELSGLTAGLMAGIMGACASELMCSVAETWHLLLAHGSVVVLLCGAGYWLGRRFLSP